MIPRNIMQIYQSFRANPMQILGRKYNITSNINTNDPNSIIQHLLNTGQVKQEQINNIATNMQNNPIVNMIMVGRR
jgi:hypothetical protein